MTHHASNLVSDDCPIRQLPETPMWSENFAYSCNSAETGISMIVLLGRWWADPTVWREVVAIALPGDRIICIKNYGRAATDRIASGAMLVHDVVRPGYAMRLVYDGPAFAQERTTLMRQGFIPAPPQRCQFEILFEGATPVWDMSGHAGKTSDLTGSLHVEQVGKGSGHVAFGNKRWEIKDAFMNRDHSRGVRIVDRYRRHCWAQGYFAEDDISFNVYAMEFHDEDQLAMANATVSKDGRRYPAVLRDIELIRGRADARRPYRILLESELGAMTLSKAITHGSIPISFMNPFDFHHGVTPDVPSAMMFEEAVTWEWQGRRGLGWSERAFAFDPLHL
jgi:hypothetical protein